MGRVALERAGRRITGIEPPGAERGPRPTIQNVSYLPVIGCTHRYNRLCCASVDECDHGGVRAVGPAQKR